MGGAGRSDSWKDGGKPAGSPGRSLTLRRNAKGFCGIALAQVRCGRETSSARLAYGSERVQGEQKETGSKSSLKNSLGGHSEEPKATKNPSFLWLFGQERFFASLRMTTKDTFPTSC